MREESSSDEDAEEPEEWEGADETSCSEEEGEEVERVSNAQRGCVRLHGVVQSSAGLKGNRGVGKGRKINNRTHLSALVLPTQTDRQNNSFVLHACLSSTREAILPRITSSLTSLRERWGSTLRVASQRCPPRNWSDRRSYCTRVPAARSSWRAARSSAPRCSDPTTSAYQPCSGHGIRSSGSLWRASGWWTSRWLPRG